LFPLDKFPNSLTCYQWLQTASGIVLLDIYSKSEKENLDVTTIQQIIANFERDRH